MDEDSGNEDVSGTEQNGNSQGGMEKSTENQNIDGRISNHANELAISDEELVRLSRVVNLSQEQMGKFAKAMAVQEELQQMARAATIPDETIQNLSKAVTLQNNVQQFVDSVTIPQEQIQQLAKATSIQQAQVQQFAQAVQNIDEEMQMLARAAAISDERLQQLGQAASVSEADVKNHSIELTPSAEQIESTYREANEAEQETGVELEESQKLFVCGFVISRRNLDRIGGVVGNDTLQYSLSELLKLAGFVALVEPAYALVLIGSAIAIQRHIDDQEYGEI